MFIGRIPVMVNSDSCWMSGADKDDCDYDQGGYFIIKGAEKVHHILFPSLVFLAHFIL